MPRFAAIDMGSNASRLLVVEADGPNRVRVLESRREPVRLGHGVFLTGKLDPDAIDRAVDALRGFAEVIDDAQVEQVRAVVTASARDAENAQVLLGRVRRETGITLEAIDGTEEARLVRMAVGRSVDLSGKRVLLVDLGGGSLELSEVDNGRPLFSTSLEIGTVRLLESFLKPGQPIGKEQERILLEYIERELKPTLPQIAQKKYDLVACTGGNFEAIAELGGKGGAPAISIASARGWMAKLARMTVRERMRTFDLRQDRADVIVPALYVLLALADAVRIKRVLVPRVGLKEGIVAEFVDKHFSVWDYRKEADVVAAAAIQLGRRYHFNETHALQVARLSLSLFDQLAPLHGLSADDRELLRLAALVHDVGEFIHAASHHKHTQYILENSEALGLSLPDRAFVGCVARYHRRAFPTTKHAAFNALSPSHRVRVRKLAAILRIADALDREHLGKVQRVRVEIKKSEVAIHAYGKGDISLEAWTVARKAELFELCFRKRVSMHVSSRDEDAVLPAPRASS